MNFNHLKSPARLFCLIEAIIAAVAAFLPLSGTQVATICAVAAVITGESLHQTSAKNKAEVSE
jgi:hypothetical protein